MFLLKRMFIQKLLLSVLLLIPAQCTDIHNIESLSGGLQNVSSLKFSLEGGRKPAKNLLKRSKTGQESPKVDAIHNVLGTPDLDPNILAFIEHILGITSGDISSILNLANVGLGVVGTLESIFTKVFNGPSIDFSIFERPGLDRQLLSLFEVISLRLDQIQDGISETQSGLRALVKGLPNIVRWEIALNTLEAYIQTINNLYIRFSFYQQHKMDIEDETLLDFAEAVVSHHSSSVQNLMANIHNMVSPSDPPKLLGSVIHRNESIVINRVNNHMSSHFRRLLANRTISLPDKLKEQKIQEISLRPSIFNMFEEALISYEICNQKSTPQQLIFGLYTTLAVTQARAFAMSNFGYNMLHYHDKGHFVSERQLLKDLYMHYSKALFRIGLQSLEGASTFYRKCDPVEHIENKTYVQVTELLQGYIENEVDLNSGGSCKQTCSNYNHTKVHGCYLPATQYCGKDKRCKGMVYECQFVDSDSQACISPQPHRRYDWVKYSYKGTFGQKISQCKNVMKIDSWWRVPYHCSYCMCFCDDASSPTSERYVSLRKAVSDIAANKVISGLRFVKKQKVIHIEVMEVVAKAQGQIDSVTSRWVDAEAMAIETNKFKEGEDYHTLKYEARNVDLDRLMAPKGHVVTGVKFRLLGLHLNLQMRITPINFSSGVLKPEMSIWISNHNTTLMDENPRRELLLHGPDSSTNNHLGSEEISTSNMYVKLQPTSLQADVGQLTVPFFDAQPVSTSPITWLEGVEIYHRGKKGYGGFIAFQIFNYNLSRPLHDKLN